MYIIEKSDQTFRSYIQHWGLSTIDQSLSFDIGTISAKHTVSCLFDIHRHQLICCRHSL